MIGSYIKTSRRNLMNNKLFSFINIIGLAISMSVGLLLIAFVLGLRSLVTRPLGIQRTISKMPL